MTGALFFPPNLPLTPLPPTFWVSLASFGTKVMVWELQAFLPPCTLLWMSGPGSRPALPSGPDHSLTSEAPPQQLFPHQGSTPFSCSLCLTCTDLSSLCHRGYSDQGYRDGDVYAYQHDENSQLYQTRPVGSTGTAAPFLEYSLSTRPWSSQSLSPLKASPLLPIDHIGKLF